MNKVEALDKIKKLLAKSSNNSNKNEAEAALLKARKLMAKYHVEDSEVKAQETELKYLESSVTYSQDCSYWAICLADVIARNHRCGVASVRKGNQQELNIRFFGEGDDPEMVEAIFSFAHAFVDKEVLRLRETVCNPLDLSTKDSLQITDSYALGFVNGLQDKYNSQNKHDKSMELMVVPPKSVADEYNKHKKQKAPENKRIYGNLYGKGYADGYGYTHQALTDKQ